MLHLFLIIYTLVHGHVQERTLESPTSFGSMRACMEAGLADAQRLQQTAPDIVFGIGVMCAPDSHPGRAPAGVQPET